MAMKNSPHLGHSIKENCLDPLGLNVTEAAKVLGVARHTLARVRKLLNNAETKSAIVRVVESCGFVCPHICSPEELGGVSDD